MGTSSTRQTDLLDSSATTQIKERRVERNAYIETCFHSSFFSCALVALSEGGTEG